MQAGAGAKVDHVVSAADGFFIVLHHQHRIAQVTQCFQRLQQAGIVPVMEANGRLVQYVKHSAQLGANLCRQPDALAFAAGQRSRGAVQ